MNHGSYSIDIHRLALHGDGVGRVASEGDKKDKVAFVPYSLPGEIIHGACSEEKKTYLRCIPRQLITRSPDRIRPACPYHFEAPQEDLWCGGCNWQHMALEKQREAKKGLVLEALQRLGRLSEAITIDLHGADNGWRYRNTAQFAFSTKGDDTIAGLYAPGSHDVVPIEDCLIQYPAAVRILRAAREIIPELGLKAYERNHHRGWLRHLLIRSNEKGQALAVLITSSPQFPHLQRCIQMLNSACPEIIGIFQNVQPSSTSTITGRKWIHRWGRTQINVSLCGLTIASSPASFLQVNTAAAQLLYQRALLEAALEPHMNVLDLYCGVGCLALLAAPSVAEVIGIDGSPSAIRDARQNAGHSATANVTFSPVTAERFLKRGSLPVTGQAGRLIVFLDPPRSGCQRAVIEGLLSLAPRRIIYLSCNPATLARDLELLGSRYHLASLAAVDLFPQTSHIETIARLERKNTLA